MGKFFSKQNTGCADIARTHSKADSNVNYQLTRNL
jgi:hypothetical protein